MRLNPSFNISGFIDDDIKKAGSFLNDLTVYHSSKLNKIINSKSIDEIFITIPSLSRSERVAKYNQLIRIEEDLGKNAKMNKIH